MGRLTRLASRRLGVLSSVKGSLSCLTQDRQERAYTCSHSKKQHRQHQQLFTGKVHAARETDTRTTARRRSSLTSNCNYQHRPKSKNLDSAASSDDPRTPPQHCDLSSSLQRCTSRQRNARRRLSRSSPPRDSERCKATRRRISCRRARRCSEGAGSPCLPPSEPGARREERRSYPVSSRGGGAGSRRDTQPRELGLPHRPARAWEAARSWRRHRRRASRTREAFWDSWRWVAHPRRWFTRSRTPPRSRRRASTRSTKATARS
mmetsp:Transcript_2141/g.5726  ORF Transcript_2141/g.5726 Transcript_2141/m.5726 type:complete len:263 (+) Transcript_2141:241-1029(+)